MVERSQDAQRSQNAAIIRERTLEYIAEHGNAPSSSWLSQITGLAEKTIKRHRKVMKLGTGEKNPFQILTPAVLEALYRRAIGYSHDEERVFCTKSGEVVTHVTTKTYPPDSAAAKLFFQVVEGFSEKQKTEHSGSIAMPFHYHAPGSPDNPAPTDADTL